MERYLHVTILEDELQFLQIMLSCSAVIFPTLGTSNVLGAVLAQRERKAGGNFPEAICF